MDAQLLETLYRKYYTCAIRYCIALCGNEHLAQDIVADAFVKAYLTVSDQIPSFRYWLLRVCKNLWYDHLRKQKHVADQELPADFSDGNTPELAYLKNEQMQHLWKTIGKLPQTDRELLTLYYFSGVSLQEAAGILGKSYNAVRQRMTRLRQTLKQEMEEQGYGKEF